MLKDQFYIRVIFLFIYSFVLYKVSTKMCSRILLKVFRKLQNYIL